MTHNPIIVALDVESAAEARALVAKLGASVDFYKVGMELYAAAGMEIVRDLQAQGKNVFLDLKFYDIPETVKRAVAQVAKTGVRFLTVHGSASIMRAAVEGKGGIGSEAARRHCAHQLRAGRYGRPRLPWRDCGTGGTPRAQGCGMRHRWVGRIAT